MPRNRINDISPQCPCCEFHRSQDRFPRKAGMFRDDLFDGFTGTKPFKDAFHSDSSAANYGFSHHDVAFGFD